MRVWVGWVDRECVEECFRVESSGGITLSRGGFIYIFSTTVQESGRHRKAIMCSLSSTHNGIGLK